MLKMNARISLLGGGTDLPWYLEDGHVGAVLSGEAPTSAYGTTKYEGFDEDVLKARKQHGFKPSLVKQSFVDRISSFLFERLNIEDTSSVGDYRVVTEVPIGSGLGGSSLIVSIVTELVLTNQSINLELESKIRLAQSIENDKLKNPVGFQDHAAAFIGGVNHIKFHNDKISYWPIQNKNFLEDMKHNTLLLRFPERHRSSRVEGSKKENYKEKVEYYKQLGQLTSEACSMLENKYSFEKLVDYINRAWELKKQLSAQVADRSVEQVFEIGKLHGVIGGKLLGAGHRGVILILAPNSSHDQIRRALPHLSNLKNGFGG